MSDMIYVTVLKIGSETCPSCGHKLEGPGYYVYEADVEDEGYVHFQKTKPTPEELKALNPAYVEGEPE